MPLWRCLEASRFQEILYWCKSSENAVNTDYKKTSAYKYLHFTTQFFTDTTLNSSNCN
jgi:hypothetical protein